MAAGLLSPCWDQKILRSSLQSPLLQSAQCAQVPEKAKTSRKIVQMLMARGLKVVAIRHPMPYGDLVKQKVQRYATVADLANMSAPLRRWKNMSLTSCGET